MTKSVVKKEKKFLTAYGEHLKVQADTSGPSLTKQQFVADADINNIIARFAKTGTIDPEILKANPVSGDFSEIGSYQESLNAVIHAETLFGALPAKVRDRFGNDPAAFVAFATNEKNRAELVELGLVEKPVSDESKPSSTAPKKDPAPPAGTPAGGGGSDKAP